MATKRLARSVCFIEGCLNLSHGLGMCSKHHSRWKRYADPFWGDKKSAARSKGITLEERFWSRVNKTPGLGPDGECWEWIGTPSKLYGSFGFRGVQYTPSRLAYTLTYGPIPEGLLCCHKCDNTRCVRPDHLFAGTPLENMHDMIAKGRAYYPRPTNQARGERVNTAVLTPSDIREIRRRRDSGEELLPIAQDFKITRTQVSRIGLRQQWKHIE